MNSLGKYLAIIIISFSISLSGCTDLNNVKSTEYAVTGCAATALAAAAVARISGKDAEAARKSALIGCLVGGVIGYSIGKRTEKYVDAHQAADAEITRNQKNTQELKDYNIALSKKIKAYQDQIAQTRSAKTNEKDKHIALQNTKRVITKQYKTANKALIDVNNELVEAKKQYNARQKSAQPAKKDNWKRQIAGLEKQKAILGKNVARLNALNSSI